VNGTHFNAGRWILKCTSRVVLVSIFKHACFSLIRICHVAEHANDPMWQVVEFLEDQGAAFAWRVSSQKPKPIMWQRSSNKLRQDGVEGRYGNEEHFTRTVT